MLAVLIGLRLCLSLRLGCVLFIELHEQRAADKTVHFSGSLDHSDLLLRVLGRIIAQLICIIAVSAFTRMLALSVGFLTFGVVVAALAGMLFTLMILHDLLEDIFLDIAVCKEGIDSLRSKFKRHSLHQLEQCNCVLIACFARMLAIQNIRIFDARLIFTIHFCLLVFIIAVAGLTGMLLGRACGDADCTHCHCSSCCAQNDFLHCCFHFIFLHIHSLSDLFRCCY